MADVFVSYARPDETLAQQVADALRAHGYSVWRDDELPAHRAYVDVIQERLKSAGAVVVLWSAEAAKSQWVRSEAEAARQRNTLVQATLDGLVPPMPFDQIQCADLSGWGGNSETPGWRKLIGSITALMGSLDYKIPTRGQVHRHAISVCVLPFANMSGDVEQEYFSDGISEDITTDLSKVSALAVTSRNIAFMFKGTAIDVMDVARKLGVSHVLEGSVRKAGNRVRITAQLIDGANGDHVWADRYDRELTDIFEIQDEISDAIVDALKVQLLPAEKKAIESRGTTNVEAYGLYLMAREQWVSGSLGDPRRSEAIIRLCKHATLLDEHYAQAWALMALAQFDLRSNHARDENALPSAERALAIEPNQPEALAVKARYLEEDGRPADAEDHLRRALQLAPDSWDVNRELAVVVFRRGNIQESISLYERAASLMDGDWMAPMMLVTCYTAAGDETNALRMAQTASERAERAISKDPTNTSALAAGAIALAMFGEKQRSREWIHRALLLDPDNMLARYNLACAQIQYLRALEDGLETLRPYFEKETSLTRIRHMQVDPDFEPIRDDPRFQNMLDAAKQRLGIREAATE